MNKQKLNQLFDAYIKNFQYMNTPPRSEYFKWYAIYEFQQVFDIDAPDFYTMLKKAKAVTGNIIDSRNQPFGGLVYMAKEEPERVRSMFRALYVNDGGDLTIRSKKINAFLTACDELLEKYYPGSHLYKNDLRSAMGYLFLHDPDTHYLYKATEATYMAECVDFYDDWGTISAFKIDVWHRFCDTLITEIRATPEIINTHMSRFEGKQRQKIDDAELHVLLFDIIYCADTYKLYSGIKLEKITSATRKLYYENKAKAQALLNAVESAERDVNLLSDAYKYLQDAIEENAIVIHKTLGELDVLKMEYEATTHALMIYVRIKKSNESKAFQLLPAVANGFIKIDRSDFNEKVTQYKAVMLKEIAIPHNLATAQNNLRPYEEYLE